jgi:hypothetical protein
METPTPVAIVPQEPSRSLEEASERRCERCSEPLTGRKLKYCSQSCNTAAWDEKHPRLGRPVPAATGKTIRERVFVLMTDGAWRTVLEIAEALGVQHQTASAELRKLRRARYGGFTIEAHRAWRPYSMHASEFRLVLRAEK